MSRRACVLAALLAVLVATALPALRIRAGRTRHAEDLAERLDAPRADARDEAERALVDLGPAALPALASLPPSASDEARLRARRVERAIRGPDDAPALRRLAVALRAGEPVPPGLIEELGPVATPALVRASRQRPEDLERLRLAVEHADAHGGPGAAEFLTGILGEDDVPAALLAAAAEGLARLAGPRELERLRPLLEDPISARRAAAVRVFLARGSATDRTRLLPLLADPSPFVRAACAGLLEEPSIRAAALPLLEDPDARVRRGAVLALTGCGDSDVFEAMRHRLDDPSPLVRSAAAEALAVAGRATDLVARQDDPTVGVRLAAARALGRSEAVKRRGS